MTWLTVTAAAELMHCTPQWLRALIRRHAVEARKVKRGSEVKLESLPPEARELYFKAAGAGQVSKSFQPDAPGPSFHEIPEAQREELLNYGEALRAIPAARADRARAIASAAHKFGVTPRTIRNDLKSFAEDGIAGLLRKQRNDAGASRVAHQQTIAKIKMLYLQQHRPTTAAIHREIVKDYEMAGIEPPSYKFVLRNTQKIDPDMVARYRGGEKVFNDQFTVVTLRQKPSLPRLWLDADHHLIDHIVIFGDGSIGRPWLTAIQDIATNEITGYIVTREKRSSYPGADTIGLAIRNAVLKKDDPEWPSFGLFENFYSDLGKDFRSSHVRAACLDLGINPVYARGYSGRSKPIERVFNTLENGLKHLPGYIGRNPETNPLHQVVGPARSWEDMRGEIMTVDQFAAALHKWIVADFHHSESRALRGLSPIGALEKHIKNGWAPREVANERALDLLMMHRKAKKVQRMGIEMFGSKGVQRFFLAPELISLIGQEVEVFYDPSKIGEIVVYKDNRFVCKAQNRELLEFGADEEMLQRERELKAAQRKSINDRIEELTAEAQYPDTMARAAAEKRHEKIATGERVKLAAGARAERTVRVLLPKYQQAGKKLTGVEKVSSVPKVSDVTLALNRFVEDDELKDSTELFQRPKNPWLDDSDE